MLSRTSRLRPRMNRGPACDGFILTPTVFPGTQGAIFAQCRAGAPEARAVPHRLHRRHAPRTPLQL